ncbi:MAG TPA: TonB-dependent receptor [Polyangiaceae bacterium]|nr:TonB-dependent receptor [Polyangiaceae bacterium]
MLGRRSLRCFGLLAMCLSATPAHADPRAAAAPRAGAASDIELPEGLDTKVTYPEGATKSATVVLEVEIDVAGNVTSAHVVYGEEPFATAAVRAADEWRFSPARRAGKPLAVRIRYTVQFEPPPVELAEEDDETPGAVPAPAQAAPVARATRSLEVVVQGERVRKTVPGAVTITREQAQALPGTFGDPLRAVEALPGVIPIVSGLPSFFIRGAPPANVGFFIDGIDVPLLYHAFFGPSVAHPALIKSVEVHKGGGPVEFGRFAGPVVAAEITPLQHRWNGEASIRTIDAGGIIEAPFGQCAEPKEGKGCSLGSVRLGGRYAYTGLVLSQLSDSKLDYWDYQGNAAIDLGRHDTLSVLAFGAYDYFDAGATSDQGGGKVRFHRLDLRWDHDFSRTHLRVGMTGGYDSTGGVEATTSAVRDRSVRLRAELSSAVSDSVFLRYGVDGRVDDYSLETDPLLLNFADYSALFPARTETTMGGYLSVEWKPTRRITVVPGLRGDLYWQDALLRPAVDPRVFANFELTETLSLDESLTIGHQRANFVPNVPGAQVADLEHGLQQAVMWSSGIHWRLPSDFGVDAAVFRTAYLNALDPLGGKRDFSIDRTVPRSDIDSAGLELRVKRAFTHKLGGFVSYTLSRTWRSSGDEESVSGFDRPHVVQAALAYDFGKGLTTGVRGVFYSGVPELNLQGTPHFTTDRRGRPYFRADVRVAKRWKLGETSYWGITAEILNATSTSEVVRLDCGVRCAQRVAGPVILPSIGVEAGF